MPVTHGRRQWRCTIASAGCRMLGRMPMPRLLPRNTTVSRITQVSSRPLPSDGPGHGTASLLCPLRSSSQDLPSALGAHQRLLCRPQSRAAANASCNETPEGWTLMKLG